ncbi:hypothetical protein ACFQ34_04005, partial [Pseudonocardia benzenivorans]
MTVAPSAELPGSRQAVADDPADVGVSRPVPEGLRPVSSPGSRQAAVGAGSEPLAANGSAARTVR